MKKLLRDRANGESPAEPVEDCPVLPASPQSPEDGGTAALRAARN